MKRFLLVSILVINVLTLTCCGSKVSTVIATSESTVNEKTSSGKIENEVFEVMVPERFDGMYDVDVNDHTINFYDKECKNEGNPGWIFGIQIFENPDDWAFGPVVKYGELKLNNGKLYDVVISYPSESQWGFREDGWQKEMPARYKSFYDARYEIAATVCGKNGEKISVGAGAKGEYLYQNELNKHLTAIKEAWDATKLEEENMSTMYVVIAGSDNNALDKVGYAYRDINNDGIDELLIGEIADGDWKGIIYDIYTMVDRKPVHVVSGWDRNRYFDYEDSLIVNEYSGGANESGVIVYSLGGNTKELFMQLAFKYDGYTDEKNPWFESYTKENDDIKWEPSTEEKFNELQNRYSKHVDPGYKAFSTIKQ